MSNSLASTSYLLLQCHEFKKYFIDLQNANKLLVKEASFDFFCYYYFYFLNHFVVKDWNVAMLWSTAFYNTGSDKAWRQCTEIIGMMLLHATIIQQERFSLAHRVIQISSAEYLKDHKSIPTDPSVRQSNVKHLSMADLSDSIE